MARYPITRLAVDAFGPFGDVDLTLSPNLNIITGENASGKTQLLKLLYASTRAQKSATALTKTELATGIANALMGVFRPNQLGRLARRVQGRSRATVSVKYQGIGNELAFNFTSHAQTEVKVSSVPQTSLDDTPVFFPSRELLSLYPGLVSLYDTREVEFDETWRDTALLLGRQALRGPRGTKANELLEPILDEIEGSVVEEGGRFYVRLPAGTTGTAKIEAHLVSEGFRKLAMIIRMVSNGVLLEGGYLFWDEPEANLNPEVQRAVASVILLLARAGTQVFVATHSIFLLRELEILLETSPFAEVAPRYIGLYRESERAAGEITSGVWGESVSDPADLKSIASLNAESAQSARYLGI